MLVVVSLPGLTERLTHRLEPGAPPPRRRLAAVRKCRREGIDVGVKLAPILPGLTDRQGQIERTIRAAVENGALWLEADVLRLPPAEREPFLRRLAGYRRDLVPLYRSRFDADGDPPRLWEERVLAMVAAARAGAGLPDVPPEPEPGAQMRLPFTGAVAG
jgi:DNA repair photolyase